MYTCLYHMQQSIFYGLVNDPHTSSQSSFSAELPYPATSTFCRIVITSPSVRENHGPSVLL